MYQLTLYENLGDKDASNLLKFKTWDNLENYLMVCSEESKRDKFDSQLISPAVFTETQLRRNDNVSYWGKIVFVDVDEIEKRSISLSDLENLRNNIQYRNIIYTTASSREEHLKFRIVFPLSINLPKKYIKSFWKALNQELNEVSDPSCKDLSRMYFLPGNYKNAYNLFLKTDYSKPEIDPLELISKYPSIDKIETKIPKEIQDKILRNKLDTYSEKYSWNNYRDCPFVEKSRLIQYNSHSRIDGSGRYHALFSFMHSIASRAFIMGYKISSSEIADLVSQIDYDNGSRAKEKGRPLEREAENARLHALKHIPEFRNRG